VSVFRDARAAFVDNMERLLDMLITHIPGAVRYACKVYRYNVDHCEFEDICQDLVILLIEGDYRRLRTFRGRVYTVAKRHVKKRLQRDCKTIALEETAFRSLNSTPDLDTSILFMERRKALRQAIAELPRRSQELFKLTIEGLSDAEIALLTGIKVDAVRKSRYELVHRLKRRFKEEGR
jgi:RNA polymerase sigma factor (sigma-70 family)